MSHPHEYLLKEFQISIDTLVPLTPQAIVDEAKLLHAELAANEAATEKQVHDALVHVGRKEFPYRKAYEELCAGDEEQRLQQLVFDRLDATVKAKLEDMTKHGVHVLDYVNSRLFEEQMASDERFQVEQAILLAHDSLNKQCNERAVERQKSYEELVARWQSEQAKLQGKIDVLKSLAEREGKWRDEILGRVAELEEGWSVVERDPTEEEIDKEIEYWTTVLAENDDETPVLEEEPAG